MARVCRACCSSAYAEDRRRFLLTYVQQCDDPGVIIKSFIDHAPTQARSPARSSKASQLGSPQRELECTHGCCRCAHKPVKLCE